MSSCNQLFSKTQPVLGWWGMMGGNQEARNVSLSICLLKLPLLLDVALMLLWQLSSVMMNVLMRTVPGIARPSGQVFGGRGSLPEKFRCGPDGSLRSRLYGVIWSLWSLQHRIFIHPSSGLQDWFANWRGKAFTYASDCNSAAQLKTANCWRAPMCCCDFAYWLAGWLSLWLYLRQWGWYSFMGLDHAPWSLWVGENFGSPARSLLTSQV